MILQRATRSLWPIQNAPEAPDIDTLFARELDRLPPIHDRHGCVFWTGVIALFVELPSLGSNSYDLLLRADRPEFVRVHREAVQELQARRRPSPSADRPCDGDTVRARPPARDRPRDLTLEETRRLFVEYGRALPLADKAVRQIVGEPEAGCLGLLLPAYHGTSERQILRSLDLTVGQARALMAGKKPAIASLGDIR